MEKEVAYITGPISGLTNGNRDNFEKAQKHLEKEGYIVVNPHEIGAELYEKWSLINEPNEKDMWCDFMRCDIRHLTLCHCVFVLKGWETSKGSLVELFIAQKLNMPIYHFEDKKPFMIDLNIIKGKPIVL